METLSLSQTTRLIRRKGIYHYRRRVTYAELANRFTQLNTPMTEPTLRNKISRGSFNAAFFLHCLALIGSETIRIASLVPYLPDHQSNLDLEP